MAKPQKSKDALSSGKKTPMMQLMEALQREAIPFIPTSASSNVDTHNVIGM
jgi:hypothetical protein